MLAGSIGAAVLGLAGLPPVDLHGPGHYVGIMDPLCGMTRAVRFLAHADIGQAWRYNPGSLALAGSALIAAARALVAAATGNWWTVEIARPAWILALIVGVIALQINQQHHASLLIQP